MKLSEQEILDYHTLPKPGKIEINSTKSFKTQRDLSIAYTPGVAVPCKEIEADEQKAYDYTAKGNLVAVITNSTAVLGLGDIGTLGGKPVMEGKAVLFKEFAKVDAIDIEVDKKDINGFCEAVEAIYKTFGGINLEDIKAPECFEIEDRLKKNLNIPVMHDDQHGTAIVAGAALLNACEIAGKNLGEINMVINGAGAAAMSCGKMFRQLGVKNILMCDSKGVLTKERADLNKYKKEFAAETSKKTLAGALHDCDVFIGVSKGGILNHEELLSNMASDPIIFAMANPAPEADSAFVASVREDAIMATGRSDYPNQINNVLGFPFIFRGALDCRATTINEEMKIAAVQAIAALAKEDMPSDVAKAYGEKLVFGKEYILPKPFDKRLYEQVPLAIARAAVQSGVAKEGFDLKAYQERLIKENEQP